MHGRRLSTSAKGLLDCLAQLQLIDPTSGPDAGPDADKDRKQRYSELMDILQSLWLTDPREGRDRGKDQVTPPTSSSGVYSGGSAGSRGSGNGGVETTEIGEIPEERVTTIIEEGEGEMDEGLGKAEEGEGETETERGEGETEGGEGETEGGEGDTESTDLPADQATPDTEQSNPGEDASTPDEQASPVPLQEHGQVLKTPESPKATETPSSDDLSSTYKSPTDTERDTPEDTSSSTPPSVVRTPLSRRVSQDPDPTWVLNLLKKLEKQFMSHYTDAMVDFKVRWDLDDNVLLDAMISELRDEVSKRIQSSIDRELRKIQGRAGRGGKSPRPPQAGHLSRESTMTEQRRRRLKVRGAVGEGCVFHLSPRLN